MRSLIPLLIIMPSLAFAACPIPPKIGLGASDVLVAVDRTDGWDLPTSIYIAWPTTDPNDPCCMRTKFDERAWRGILDQHIPRGITTLTEFALAVTNPPPPAGDLTQADRAKCAQMFERILGPAPTVVRNNQRPDGSRPLKVLRDPTQPYSAANPMIDLKIGNVIQYVEPGRVCDRLPVINTTTSGKWLYVTNTANLQGIALCK